MGTFCTEEFMLFCAGILYLTTFLAVVILLVCLTNVCLSRVELAQFSKRCVFITGCDTGFGNLLARTLDNKGILVIAGCLTEKGANDLKNNTSSRLKTLIIDVTDKKSVREAFIFTRDQTKETGLWGVVNNAGIMQSYAPTEWTTIEEFERTCRVNLFGTISVTLTFLPLLRQSKGRLVNVCSVTSNCGYPGLTSYVTSKAAVKTFTSCLRRELLNTGVTAHTIEPGGFQTQLTDKNKMFDSMVQAFRTAEPDAKNFYGGNISNYITGGIKLTAKYVSTRPQSVADAMTHALLSKYPKMRYLVGTDAHLFFRMLSLLPERAGDYILGWPKPYGQFCPDLLEGKLLTR